MRLVLGQSRCDAAHAVESSCAQAWLIGLGDDVTPVKILLPGSRIINHTRTSKSMRIFSARRLGMKAVLA